MLSVDGKIARTLEGRFSSWSPNGEFFTINKYLAQEEKWQLFIESPDGAISYPICCGQDTFWNSDGTKLISGSLGDKYYLFDLKTGQTMQIDLPPGSVVTGWE
jgi:hypothetical protein